MAQKYVVQSWEDAHELIYHLAKQHNVPVLWEDPDNPDDFPCARTAHLVARLIPDRDENYGYLVFYRPDKGTKGEKYVIQIKEVAHGEN